MDPGPRRILRRDHFSLRRFYRQNWSGSIETRSGTSPQDKQHQRPSQRFRFIFHEPFFWSRFATNTSRHSNLIEDTPPAEKLDLVDLMYRMHPGGQALIHIFIFNSEPRNILCETIKQTYILNCFFYHLS